MASAGGNNSVVECDLAKVEVAGSNPVSRSNFRPEFRRKLSRRSAQREGGQTPSAGDPQRTSELTLKIGAVAKW